MVGFDDVSWFCCSNFVWLWLSFMMLFIVLKHLLYALVSLNLIMLILVDCCYVLVCWAYSL